MLLVALTGGIAAGKSMVAERLEALGAVHIDADVVAREVVEPGTPALERIVDHFGQGVLLEDGSLDRAALGEIVFSDPTARGTLNAIVHPAVRDRTEQLFTEAGRTSPRAVVIYNVPLLAETGRQDRFDMVVVVHAAVETRRHRLIKGRGMSAEEATRRIEAQADDAQRLALADVVIDNDGDRAATLASVDALWRTLQARAAAQSHGA